MTQKEKMVISKWNRENTIKNDMADYKFLQIQELCKQNELTVYCNLEENMKQLINAIVQDKKEIKYNDNVISLGDLMLVYAEYYELKGHFKSLRNLIHKL